MIHTNGGFSPPFCELYLQRLSYLFLYHIKTIGMLKIERRVSFLLLSAALCSGGTVYAIGGGNIQS